MNRNIKTAAVKVTCKSCGETYDRWEDCNCAACKQERCIHCGKSPKGA